METRWQSRGRRRQKRAARLLWAREKQFVGAAKGNQRGAVGAGSNQSEGFAREGRPLEPTQEAG